MAGSDRPPLVVPPDLAAALQGDPAARAVFDRLSYTHRREHIEALLEARKPETRARRLDRTMAMLRTDRPSLSNTVSTRDPVAKLKIGPGQLVLVLDADDAAMSMFVKLPSGCHVIRTPGEARADVVILFASTSAVLARQLPVALGAGKPGAPLWVAFPKLTSGRASTLTRDAGWEPLTDRGMKSLSLIALDDTWAAVRYRIA
jgi:hypothetical protein